MPVFLALSHRSDSKQVNITLSLGAATGTWYRETSSTDTLDFENGTFVQTIYSGNPVADRQLRGPNNEPLLLLKGYLPGSTSSSGSIEFSIEGGPGSFGTDEAFWTRLEG